MYGNVLKGMAYLLSDYSLQPELKIPELLVYNKDFP